MRKQVLAFAAVSVMVAGAACAHPSAAVQGGAAGDVAIDSLTATRTAILRVENNYPGDVRIYAILGGQKSYIAEAPANAVRSVVLDPNLFPATGMQLSVEPEHTSIRDQLGPYTVHKSETIDLLIPSDAAQPQVSVQRTFR